MIPYKCSEGETPIQKNAQCNFILPGVTPIEKNIRVLDELGNEYEATWLKRAKGLVKHGRARFINETTICLCVPPMMNQSEENNMSEHNMENTQHIHPDSSLSAQIAEQIIPALQQLQSTQNAMAAMLTELSKNLQQCTGAILGVSKALQTESETLQDALDDLSGRIDVVEDMLDDAALLPYTGFPCSGRRDSGGASSNRTPRGKEPPLAPAEFVVQEEYTLKTDDFGRFIPLSRESVIAVLQIPHNALLQTEFFRELHIDKAIFASPRLSLPQQLFYLSTLRAVSLPDSLETIGRACFRSTHLQAVVLPPSVRTIEDEAFFGTELSGALHIPQSVQSIGATAFYGCPNLSDIYLENPSVRLCTRMGDPIWSLSPSFHLAGCKTPLGYARIHGYPGSTAEQYCRDLGISDHFIPILPQKESPAE